MGQFDVNTIDGLPILKKPQSQPNEIDGLPVLKKKDSTPALPSGVNVSGTGSNTFLPSQANTDLPIYAAVKDPVLRNKLKNQDKKDLESFQNKLHAATEAYAQAHNGKLFVPDEPIKSEDELKEYKAPTTIQRLEGVVGSLNKGVEETVGSSLSYVLNKAGLLSDKDYARAQDDIANNTDATFGLHPRYLKEGMGSIQTPINQLADLVPALVTAPETGGVSFGLKQLGDAATNIEQMKKNGVEFKNHSDDLFILGNGIIGTFLGRGTMGKAFNSLTDAAQGNIASKLTSEAIAELPENATSEEIASSFIKKATSWGEQASKAPLKAISTYAKVGTEMSLANIANTGLKMVANKLSGNQPFGEVKPDEFVQDIKEPFGLDDAKGSPLTALKNMVTSQAGGFGVLEGGLGMLGRYSGYTNPVIERLHTNNTPEEVEKLKNELTEIGKHKGWSNSELQQTHQAVDKMSDVINTLPKDLKPEKMQRAVSIVIGRNDLEGELKQLQENRSKLDYSIGDISTEREDFLQNKIDQANDKLRSIFSGDRTTYSKGVGDEEGKFFKTTDGVREEITPERYQLESTERDAKQQEDETVPLQGGQEATTKEEPTPTQEGETVHDTPQGADVKQEGGKENAVQEQKPDESLLREERPKVGLQEVGEGDAKQEKSSKQKEKFSISRKAGDPLREFASKVRDGKINKLGGFRSSSLFDKAWDGSLEAVATSLEGGAKLADAIEAGLNHIRATKWYKKLKNKDDFEKQYKDHLTKEFNDQKTGVRHEDTAKERATTGGEPYTKTKNRGPEAIEYEGKRRVDENQHYADETAKDIIEKERPASAEEQAALLYRKVQLKNKKRVILKDTDPENRVNNELEIARIEDEIARNQLATDIGGSELGSGLGYRTQQMNDDYSTETVMKRATVANAGEKLSPEDEAYLKEQTKRIEELENQLADREDQIRKMQEDSQVDKVKKASDYENRKNKRENTKASLKKEREGLINELHDIAKKAQSNLGANKIPVEMLAPLSKLARNYILDGITTLEGLVDKIYEDLKEHVSWLKKDELADALKDEFEKFLDEHEATKLSDAKKRAQKTIDDLQKRIDSGEYKTKRKSGVTPDEELKSLRDKIADQRKILKDLEKQSPEYEKERLSKAKNRLQKRLESLKEKYLSENPESAVQRKLRVDNDYLSTQAEIKRVQTLINGRIADIEDSQKSVSRRSVDMAVKWGRQFKLASIPVLFKLAATGITTMGVTAVQDLTVGKFFSKVLPKIAKKSTVEGAVSRKSMRAAAALTEGRSARSIGQAYARAATKGMEDASKELNIKKGGQSDLSALYGKYQATRLPAEAADFFGHLHSAIKAPVKRFAWEHSYAKRVAKMIDKGLDPLDPINDAENRMKAYEDANRAIFMGDNVISKAYESAVTTLEHGSSSAKNAAAVFRILLPFVKVPTNIVLSSGRYAFGLPMGVAKLAQVGSADALRRAGMEGMSKLIHKNMGSLTEEEADMVLRNLKRGSIGGAAVLLGFFNPQNVGGYYQKGEQRNPSEAKAGGFEVAGVHMPLWIAEHPIFQAMQIGATFRRVLDAHTAKGDGIKAATLATAAGIGEHVPLGEEMKQFTDLFDTNNTHKVDQFISGMVKGEIEPAFMQQIAQSTDVKPGADNLIPGLAFTDETQQKRDPDKYHGFFRYLWQNLKTGVPGARETVNPK